MAVDGTRLSEVNATSDGDDADKLLIERSLRNYSLTREANRKNFTTTVPSALLAGQLLRRNGVNGGAANDWVERTLTANTPADGDMVRWTTAPDWAAGVGAINYALGDIVLRTAITYVCIQAHSTSQDPATQTAYWRAEGTGTGDFVASNPRWRIVPKGLYTDDARASSSTITVLASQAIFAVGLPLRFKHSGAARYAIITAYSGTTLTIAGAELTAATEISELAVGTPEMIFEKVLYLPGTYGSGDTNATKLLVNGSTDIVSYIWRKPKAYLVTYSAINHNVAGGQGNVSPVIGTDVVSTENANQGVTLSSSANTWVHGSAVTIDTTKYDITFGEIVELTYTAGTASETDLHVLCVFIYE